MARPKGTTRRPTAPPPNLQTAIVRALLGAQFPVALGWRLFRIHSLRRERDDIKSGTAPNGRAEVFSGDPHAGGELVESVSRLEIVAAEFHAETEAFGLDCQLAAITGDDGFLAHAADGVRRLSQRTGRDRETMAVADAWATLTGYGSRPCVRAEVTHLANEIGGKDILLDSAATRDALRRLGING